MNTEAMRQNIAEAKARLEAIEVEREALATFIDGAERVLSLPIASHQESPAITIRDAIRDILKEADGAVVNSSDMARRISTMNVSTTAKNLGRSVDTTLFQMSRSGEPIEKVSPKMWRWKGNLAGLLAVPDAPPRIDDDEIGPAGESAG